MGFTVAHGLILIVAAASVFPVSMASRGSYHGFSHSDWAPKNHSDYDNHARCPQKFIVGGPSHWTFGFNYSLWASQNAPFFLNDVLVFKYDAPNATVFPHSVYLLPDLCSYLTCDLSNAKLIANTTQGVGDGFEFVLKRPQPYFFACGEGGGFHCTNGSMKFRVTPPLFLLHH